MKLWLDDLRIPPDENWTWVKTAPEAISLLAAGGVSVVSLDNDLGEGEPEGREVMRWLLADVFLNRRWPPVICIHTANPVAREYMEGLRETIMVEVATWPV